LVIAAAVALRQVELRAFEMLQSALVRLAGEKRLLPAA
jgi:hypothetical protein